MGETLDGLLSYTSSVALCAEVHLAVKQALVTAPGAVPADIAEIHSKQEALSQCAGWLSKQYPHARLIAAASTSAAILYARCALNTAPALPTRSHTPRCPAPHRHDLTASCNCAVTSPRNTQLGAQLRTLLRRLGRKRAHT